MLRVVGMEESWFGGLQIEEGELLGVFKGAGAAEGISSRLSQVKIFTMVTGSTTAAKSHAEMEQRHAHARLTTLSTVVQARHPLIGCCQRR